MKKATTQKAWPIYEGLMTTQCDDERDAVTAIDEENIPAD